MTALPLSFGTNPTTLPSLMASGLEGESHPWLTALRRDAMARHLENGLPTPKSETWKYTNLRDLTKPQVEPAGNASSSPKKIDGLALLPEDKTYRFLLRNGQILSDNADGEALLQGLRLESLADALKRDPGLVRQLLAEQSTDGDSLRDLNTALLQGGFLISLEEGTKLDRPLELHHLAEGNEKLTLHHARNFIRLGAGSHLQIVESFAGTGGAYLRNPMTGIRLAPKAELQHFILQRDHETAFHLAQVTVEAAEKADYRLLQLNLGARLSRFSLRVDLQKGASFDFKAAQVLDGDRHGDITTDVHHLAPESLSNQTVKQILDDASRGVYQGRIQVHPGALQSDGRQLSRALLLSDKAEADAKPELEIYADDVKCSHGCTFGDLDEDMLFYLRSRGIPAAKARALLVEAFLVEIFEGESNEDLAMALQEVTAAKLHSLGQESDANPDSEAGRS